MWIPRNFKINWTRVQRIPIDNVLHLHRKLNSTIECQLSQDLQVRVYVSSCPGSTTRQFPTLDQCGSISVLKNSFISLFHTYLYRKRPTESVDVPWLQNHAHVPKWCSECSMRSLFPYKSGISVFRYGAVIML